MRLALSAALGLALLSSAAEASDRHGHSSRSHQSPSARSSYSSRSSYGHSHSTRTVSSPSRTVVVSRPVVHIAVGNPWAPTYRQPSRAGYVWVSGSYDRGYYMPGYWQALYAPGPDMVWVPGYWQNNQYFEGYWRSSYRPGYAWSDGYYEPDGYWVSGGWVDVGGSVSVGTRVGNVNVEVHAPLP